MRRHFRGYFRKILALTAALGLVFSDVPTSSAAGMGKPGDGTVTQTSGLPAVTDSIDRSHDGLSADGYTLTIDGVDYPVGGVQKAEFIAERHTGKKKRQTAPRTDTLSFKSVPESATIYDNYLSKCHSTYGYSTLTPNQKKAYDDIYSMAVKFAKSGVDMEYLNPAEFPGKNEDDYTVGTVKVEIPAGADSAALDAVTALKALYFDNPQFYWMTLTYSFSYSSETHVVNGIDLRCKKEYATAAARTAADKMIMNGITNYFEPAYRAAGTDVYEQIRAIHDALVEKVDYSYEADGKTPSTSLAAHSVIGVFDDSINAVVCEGYAKAFVLLASYFGIPSIFVVGFSEKSASGKYSGDHAWNLVSPDGGKTYYYIDATWDDNNSKKTNLGHAKYTWYMIRKTDFCKHHFPYTDPSAITDKGWIFSLPSNIGDAALGSAGDLSYYKTYGCYIPGSSKDPGWDEALKTINAAIKGSPGKDYVQLMFGKDSSGSGDCSYHRNYSAWLIRGNQTFTSITVSHIDGVDAASFFKRPLTSITNKNYKTKYGDGETVASPLPENFVYKQGDTEVAANKIQLVSTWYKGTTKLADKPTAAGDYTLELDAEVEYTGEDQRPHFIHGTTLRLPVTVGNPAPVVTSTPAATPTTKPTQTPAATATAKPTQTPAATTSPQTSTVPAVTTGPGETTGPIPTGAPTQAPTYSILPLPTYIPSPGGGGTGGGGGGTYPVPTAPTGIPTAAPDGSGATYAPIPTSDPGVEVTTDANGNTVIKTEEEAGDGSVSRQYVVTSGNTVKLTASAFSGESGQNIEVPETITVDGRTYRVTSVAPNAFRAQSDLRTAWVGDNVRSIGSGAFSRNRNLNRVTLGKGVKSIGKQAFKGDSALTYIYIRSTKLNAVGKGAFRGISSQAVIYIRGTKKQYKKTAAKIRASGLPAGVKLKRKK